MPSKTKQLVTIRLDKTKLAKAKELAKKKGLGTSGYLAGLLERQIGRKR